MSRFAALCRPSCDVAVRLFIIGLAIAFTLHPVRSSAASGGVENLINKLPDPDHLVKSPLETAIASQDPMFKDPEFVRLTSMVRSGSMNLNAALNASRALVAKYPDKPAPHFLHGAFALTLKQYPEAEAAFRQAVKLQPNFALAWMAVATCDVKQDHPADGADAARHVTQLQPKFALGWGALASCEAREKKYDDAIKDFQHALSLRRNYGFASRGLGMCYVATNRPGDAIAPLKAAVALYPKDYLAATELGYCYLLSGHFDDGTKVCWQAIRARSEFGKAWDVLGMCYRQEGKKREALDAFQHAAKATPDDSLIRKHLAEATQAARRV